MVTVPSGRGIVRSASTIEHIERTMPTGVPLIFARTASGKSLLDKIEERGRFPSSPVRFCTSDFKRTPIERELRRYLKANPRFEGRLVSAMGLRRDESAARARKTPWKRSDRNSRAGWPRAGNYPRPPGQFRNRTLKPWWPGRTELVNGRFGGNRSAA